MADIELEGVAKVYPDGTEAVYSTDLHVPDGALMVLVGPSGCGKTTILRMVAGLEDITSGAVRIGDRIVNDIAPKDRDIAMVFQNYALYPHMTVEQNMGYGLKLKKVAKDEIARRVRGAAETLGLDELLDKKPLQLSGGQRQRVAMGRAIVREPQVFLMDEPLSNLDAKLRVQMRTEISRIQRHVNVTTMYVTHDQTEAMTMGDRVAVLRKGVLQQVDTPQNLYDRPANLFVAGFIGSPAMNMVMARPERVDGKTFVTFGGHRLEIDSEALEDHPGIGRYEGREVVLGLRPEHMEDATFVPDAPEERCFTTTTEVREAMGAEIYVHFVVDAPPVVTEDTRDLAADAGEAAIEALEEEAQEHRTRLVGRMNARSGARVGEAVRVFVDTRSVHFFDPETGRPV
jgi:multiple sugar transport system ATP-binding protein